MELGAPMVPARYRCQRLHGTIAHAVLAFHSCCRPANVSMAILASSSALAWLAAGPQYGVLILLANCYPSTDVTGSLNRT